VAPALVQVAPDLTAACDTCVRLVKMRQREMTMMPLVFIYRG